MRKPDNGDWAGSGDRCTFRQHFLHDLRRELPAQHLPRPVVQQPLGPGDLLVGDLREPRALREELANEPDDVLVRRAYVIGGLTSSCYLADFSLLHHPEPSCSTDQARFAEVITLAKSSE